jgi:hypothetical protein
VPNPIYVEQKKEAKARLYPLNVTVYEEFLAFYRPSLLSRTYKIVDSIFGKCCEILLL